MTELEIINHLLCQACNKPPDKISVQHDSVKNDFLVTTFCCVFREFRLPYLNDTFMNVAMYYIALTECCNYIEGARGAGSPTSHDWALVGKLFSNAGFGKVNTEPVFCDCGAIVAQSPGHADWCSLTALLKP